MRTLTTIPPPQPGATHPDVKIGLGGRRHKGHYEANGQDEDGGLRGRGHLPEASNKSRENSKILILLSEVVGEQMTA